jgi:hypothetical protein
VAYGIEAIPEHEMPSRKIADIDSRIDGTRRDDRRCLVISAPGIPGASGISSRWLMEPELASGGAVPVLSDWKLPSADSWAL